MKTTFIAMLATVLVASASAQQKGTALEYKQGDAVLEGYLARPAGEPKAAILIIHDWDGLGDYERRRADMLADLGYVAFAADVYGKGVRPANPQESRAESSKYRQNRDLLLARLNAGLDAIENVPGVDDDRIVAMGYCFGGGAVLELARSGANLASAVSFHGGLGTENPAKKDQLKAKVLVMHGAADPGVPWEQVTAFKKEMDDAGADWQLIAFGGAVHAFTVPEAGNDPSRGAAYDAEADRYSWRYFTGYMDELFSSED